jgi:hypothetical protein
MSPQSSQCITCARYRGMAECAAYPDGIPPEVMEGTIDHTQPYAGDHGLQWVAQSDDDLADEKLAWPDGSAPA